MDPYLEAPALWPDVHATLIVVMREALNAQVTPKYFVRIEEQVYVSSDTDPGRVVLVPDLRVRRMEWEQAAATAAAATEAAPVGAVEVTHLLDVQVRQRYLEIVDQKADEVVAVIELLSPANKVRAADGRKDYLRKRRDLLGSAAHLIEIDLLRRGRGVFPSGLVPAHDYLVHLSRSGGRAGGRRSWVWAVDLPRALPTVPVPLRGRDPDAALDLQSALRSAYDRAGYQHLIDYRKDPVPRLKPHDAAWADGLLRAAGLRG